MKLILVIIASVLARAESLNLNSNQKAEADRLTNPKTHEPKEPKKYCNRSKYSDWTYNEACDFAIDELYPPVRWAEKYPDCGGNSQSPVDISLDKISHICEEAPINGDLMFDSGDCSFEELMFVPSVKSWEILFDKTACNEVPTMHVDEAKYVLEKMHFHSKSEHVFNGEQEDAELHLIHRNINDSTDILAVAVILDAFEEIREPTLLSKYLFRMKKAADLRDRKAADEEDMDEVNFDEFNDEETANPYNLLPEEESYFTYLGSLTTPPCTPNVRWMVVHMPKLINKRELELLRKSIQRKNGSVVDSDGFNVRPVQELNDRQIYACV